MSALPEVVLATCSEAPLFARAEQTALLLALGRHGLTAEPVPWDRPGFPWHEVRACVVRSTWDYHLRLPAFQEWVRHVSLTTPLFNPAPVLLWNTDKRYLRALAGEGLPVPPTAELERGDRLEEVLRARGWTDVVLKPAVSAGAHHTLRVRAGDLAAGQRLLEEITAAGGLALVQPYLRHIDRDGERSFIYVDGQYSHGVRRQPALTAGPTAPSEPAVATTAERALALRAFAAVDRLLGPQALLYARVDLVAGDDGQPLLMELELTEPSLFIQHQPQVAERLAQALLARLDLRPGLSPRGRTAR